MTVRPTTLNLEAVKRASVGSVLTYGDSDWAGDADRFSVSGAASWLRGKLGWYSIIASSRKKSTISSSEAELVAALSGACEGMSLRQQWNWLRQFGRSDEETTGASQQILCSDSSAALTLINSKNDTHRAESVFLTTIERATRSTTCSSGNERDACILPDEDTVDTKSGSPLDARIGNQIQS